MRRREGCSMVSLTRSRSSGGGWLRATVRTMSNGQDRTGSFAHDPLGNGAQQYVAQAGAPVSGDHDELHMLIARILDDGINGASPAHCHLNRRWYSPGRLQKLLKTLLRPLFVFLVELRRHDGH